MSDREQRVAAAYGDIEILFEDLCPDSRSTSPLSTSHSCVGRTEDGTIGLLRKKLIMLLREKHHTAKVAELAITQACNDGTLVEGQALGGAPMAFNPVTGELLYGPVSSVEPMLIWAKPDELNASVSSSEAAKPASQTADEREARIGESAPDHQPAARPTEESRVDNSGGEGDSSVPSLDLESGDWVSVDKVAGKYGVIVSTLADYRSATRRQERPVDAVGFWFRSDPKKPSNEPPYYYWPRAEKVIAAKGEKKKTKTPRRN